MKSDTEPKIRHLIDCWLSEQGFPFQSQKEPSFSDFYMLLQSNHSSLLCWRTTTSVRYDVEMWFDKAVREKRRYWVSMQPAKETQKVG